MKHFISNSAITILMSLAVATATAQSVAPPSVPANLVPPPGNQPFLKASAVGTQNYVCSPSDGGYKFVLFTPQATLYTDDNRQLTTHFFSPNPFEDDTVRATWQDSRDTSRVWGQAIQSSTDPSFV